MAEEQEGGGSLKSILIGLASTIALGVGGFVTKQLTGEEEASPAPASVSAPAPVINITTNNTQQQKQASGGGTKIVERVVEKPAQEKPKKKTAKEELEEAPKW
jgi:hypothetical protein